MPGTPLPKHPYPLTDDVINLFSIFWGEWSGGWRMFGFVSEVLIAMNTDDNAQGPVQFIYFPTLLLEHVSLK